MERSTSFNGKIHYFYGHFQSQTVKLPEGTIISQQTTRISKLAMFDDTGGYPLLTSTAMQPLYIHQCQPINHSSSVSTKF